jgi:hypothetical protein
MLVDFLHRINDISVQGEKYVQSNDVKTSQSVFETSATFKASTVEFSGQLAQIYGDILAPADFLLSLRRLHLGYRKTGESESGNILPELVGFLSPSLIIFENRLGVVV